MSRHLPSFAPDDLRDELAQATSALLGATMGLSEEQWREPSRLPGWTRAHLGAHIAQNARALHRVIEGVLNGAPVAMFASAALRDHEIEQGATQTGVELQTSLDTTASRFARTIDGLSESQREDEVELRNGFTMPLGQVSINRLSEVVFHHVDLDTGFVLEEASARSIEWLLQFWAFRLHRREDFPSLLLDTGEHEYEVGNHGWGTNYRRLSGSPVQLLAWITGRGDGSEIEGASEVTLPPLS